MAKNPPTADVPTLETRRYLDVKATAARLGYSSQYIVASIEEGRLPAVNIARDPGKTRPEYRIRSEAVIP